MERKQIFSKCQQLKATMYISAIVGIWPLIFEDNPKLKKIYNLYSKIILTFFITFSITVYIKFLLILSEKPLDVSELFANLTLNFYFTVMIWKALIFKDSRFQQLLKAIISLEKRILESKDPEIIRIYNYYVWQTTAVGKGFILFILLGTFFCISRPLVLDPVIKYNPLKNETKIIRPLPLSSWFPWDEEECYVQHYLLHVFSDLVAGVFSTTAESVSYSITIFLLGQIAILNHILSNFGHYVLTIQEQLQVGMEEANFLTMRECILKHKEIIEHTNIFNESMRMVVLYDFLQSSMGLAAGILSLVYIDVSPSNFIFFLTFVMGSFFRILINYWFANEVIIKSSNTLNAIWNARWYNEPLQTRRLKLIMMLRCTNPLYLEIGPFAKMSLITFLKIVKATYSYMTLILNNKN